MTVASPSRRRPALMTTGGDARIVPRPGDRPQPLFQRAAAERRARLRLLDRQRHLGRGLRPCRGAAGGDRRRTCRPAIYAARLEALRGRIRARLCASPDDVDDRLRAVGHRPRICRSGLRRRARRRAAPTTSCSAPTRSAAAASIPPTASISPTRPRSASRRAPGEPVPGPRRDAMSSWSTFRCATGRAGSAPRPRSRRGWTRRSRAAEAAGRHVLVHVVHGSKTGLILPSLDDIDRLRGSAWRATSPSSSTPARRGSPARRSHDYLARGAIVFVTGSKFMGGPPFSGFALVPRRFAEAAPAAARGLRDHLPARRMAGRLAGRRGAAGQRQSRPAASARGLDLRARALPGARRRGGRAGHPRLPRRGARRDRRADPGPPGRPLSARRQGGGRHPPDRDADPLDARPQRIWRAARRFEDAQAGTRRCSPTASGSASRSNACACADGRWGATLRIGLSMPQVVDRAALDDEALRAFERHGPIERARGGDMAARHSGRGQRAAGGRPPT